MAKLQLKKPAWAERIPEKEWLDRIFSDRNFMKE